MDFSPHPEPVCLLGIEIGGTKLQLAAGDSRGRILHRARFAVERAAGAEGIRAQIKAALPQLAAEWKPSAIGVGYGGPVDWRTGKIACSHHIAGWSDFPLGEWLSQQTGLPSFVENDANTAALGEALFGAGQGADPVLWMNSGSGVGGGLVTGGRIYHGAQPGEMELGHLRLDRSGTITEDLCSGWSIDRMVREAAATDGGGTLARALSDWPAEGGEASILGRALAQGDTVAQKILREVGDSMAYALSHAAHLLHPQVVVLGGGVALLGEPLRARIAESLPGWLMEAFRPGPEIRLAALMEDAVLVGALAVAALRHSPFPSQIS
jgi:glucokinase